MEPACSAWHGRKVAGTHEEMGSDGGPAVHITGSRPRGPGFNSCQHQMVMAVHSEEKWK